jgi:predicted nucleotidyltransferase
MVNNVTEIWESIKEEVLEYLKDTEILSLIAHGSFAEGFANSNSDFDLLVVCQDDVEERTEIIVVNNMEVDIDFLHEKTLLNQLESMNELLTPGPDPPFASRLKNAIILVDSNNTGKTLVDIARKYEPSFQLMDHYSKLLMGFYYDAVGAMVSGDYATSVHMARLAALEALAGIMLQQGELYVKKKWLIEYMNKHPAPKELFLTLMGLDTADKEQAKESIRDLNKLISEFQRLREQKK